MPSKREPTSFADRLLMWIDGESWKLVQQKAETSPVRIAIVGKEWRQVTATIEHAVFATRPSAPPSTPQLEYRPSRGLITWPNGSTVQLFTASRPENIRGHRFDFVFCIDQASWEPRIMRDRCIENLIVSLRA